MNNKEFNLCFEEFNELCDFLTMGECEFSAIGSFTDYRVEHINGEINLYRKQSDYSTWDNAEYIELSEISIEDIKEILADFKKEYPAAINFYRLKQLDKTL